MSRKEQVAALDAEVFRQAFEQASDSIVITDARAADHPMVYVNPGFERLTGHQAEALLGTNCRLLQRDDRDQAARHGIRQAIENGLGIVEVLRNYRADGRPFWNELSLSPLCLGSERPTHYLGMLRDVSRYVDSRRELETTHQNLRRTLSELNDLASTDPLTDLRNRRHFDLVLDREWHICQREKQPLSLALIDVDHFKRFNDRYGHLRGDECLRNIAGIVSARFHRGGDLVARFGGDELVVLAPRQEAAELADRLQGACNEVAALAFPEVDAAPGVVSISVGVATRVPAGGEPEQLIEDADRQMYRAKASPGGGVGVAQAC